MIVLLVVGLLLAVVGLVWLGQGVGLIGGSFMTGHAFWAVAGVVMSVLGLALVRAWRRARTV